MIQHSQSRQFPAPGGFELGSPESRAAARAMADEKRGSPNIMLIGRRESDGQTVAVCIYDGGQEVEQVLP